MKSKIFLFAILALLFACKGDKLKNTSKENTGTMKQTGETVQGTADVTNVNIKDIFLLLPEKVFPEVPITVAQRKELLECIGEERAYEIYSFPIEICDVKNGFLQLAMQFIWEVTYWNLKDGRGLAIVFDINERDDCFINYFFYENGKLIQDNNFRLDKNQYNTLSDFIDVSQLSSDACTFKEEQFAQLLYSASVIASETAIATPVNIKDIFLLLPNDSFEEEEISVANRKLLLNHIGEKKAYDISHTPIEVCDVKNGYLSLTGMQFGWEMCYWNLKDGRKLVAINDLTESGSKIRTFYYQNGKLTEDNNYQLGGNQNYKLTDFIDVSQLSSNIRKLAEEQFAKGNYIIYYDLPQKGTSLTVSVDDRQLLDYHETYEIPYEAIKKVTLKWVNEKWEK